MKNIQQLVDKLQTHLKAAGDIAATAENDERDFTDDERTRMQELLGKAENAKTKLAQAKADDQLLNAVAELGEHISVNQPNGKTASPGTRSRDVPAQEQGSVGEHFVSSKAYTDLVAAAPNGQFGEKMRVQSAPVGFKNLITGASDTSAGVFVQNDWRGLQVGLEAFQRPLRLRDVVTPGTTTSDTIEYARITGVTNNAAPVPEATEVAGTSGTKPMSGMTTAKVTTPVRTIAHWIPVTRRALSDAAQIRTLIDAYLRYGLEEELEDQMIAGDGTGENLEGLVNVSGVQHQPYEGPESDLNLLRTLRKAKTKVRLIGRSEPNTYVLNPEDVERIDLTVDGEDRFYFGGPAAAGRVATLWGLPVIETDALPAGVGYVGDWRKAILWDREQASVTVSDSHADFFIRNMVAILGELRVAWGVVHPQAFTEVQLRPQAKPG